VTIDPAVLADPERFMRAALGAAEDAVAAGDLPVATAGNRRAVDHDPTAHAEMLVLREAAAAGGEWRLSDVTVVVTLEPCPMCAGALWAARIGGLVFGAADMKAGATGSLYHLGSDPRLNHEYPTVGGVLAAECATLLTDFFAARREPA